MEERLIAQAAPQPELINNSKLSFLAALGGTKDMSKHNSDMFSSILSSLVNNDATDNQAFDVSTSDTTGDYSSNDNSGNQDSDNGSDITAGSETGNDYESEEIAYEEVTEVSDYTQDAKREDSSATEADREENRGSEEKVEKSSDNNEGEEKATDNQETKNVSSEKEGQGAEKSETGAETTSTQVKDVVGELIETHKGMQAEDKSEFVNLVKAEVAEKKSDNNVNEVKEAAVEKKSVVSQVSDIVSNKDAGKNTQGVNDKVVADTGKIVIEDKDLKDESLKDSEIIDLIGKGNKNKAKNAKVDNLNATNVKQEVKNTDVVADAAGEGEKANQASKASDKVKPIIVKDSEGNKVNVVVENESKGNLSEQNNAKQEEFTAEAEVKTAKVQKTDRFDAADNSRFKNVEQQVTTEETSETNAAKASTKTNNVLNAASFNMEAKSVQTEQAAESKSIDMMAGSKSVTGAQSAGKAGAATSKGAAPSQATTYTSNVNESKVVEQILIKARLNIKQNSKEMNLRLDPPELGKVNMKLSLSNNNILTAKIEVANDAVRAAVNNNVNSLRESLSSEGIKIDKFDVFVKDDNSQNQQNQDQKQGKSSSTGNVFEEEAIDINEIKEEVLAEAEAAEGKVNFLA